MREKYHDERIHTKPQSFSLNYITRLRHSRELLIENLSSISISVTNTSFEITAFKVFPLSLFFWNNTEIKELTDA